MNKYNLKKQQKLVFLRFDSCNLASYYQFANKKLLKS